MKFNHAFVTPPILTKGDRCYTTPEGNSYESVTTYIGRNWDKSFLIEWRKRVGAEKAAKISSAAIRRGTSLHKVTEKYLMNEELDLDDDPTTKALFNKIQPLIDRLNNIRLLETPLYSHKLQLAGTPDCIADYSNALAVVDFKTSTRVKKKKEIVDYFLQCACYAEMYNEHYGQMPEKAIIIMAIPDLPYGMTYIHPMDKCVKMLEIFRTDPVLFQNKIKEIVE